MNTKKFNILYVDDEAANLRIFKSVFERNYNIYTAENGEEGLNVLKEQPIDLILTDQRMPNMTGTELLKIVKKDYPAINRIIVTGFTDMEAIHEAINEVGIFHYVEKPWEPEALKQVIDNALENSQLKVVKEESSQKLEESEIQKRSIIDTALDAVIIINASGKVIDWNLRAEKIFGWSKEEALDQELVNLIIPDKYKKAHKSGVEMYRNTGKDGSKVINKRIELEGQRKNGEIFPVELTVTPIKLDGRTIFSGFLRDISERKRIEEEIESLNKNLEEKVKKRTEELKSKQEELQQAKFQADAANEAKTKFLANMSHEIRSPLNAIIGFSQILMNQLGKMEAPDKFREYFHNIEVSGKNLSEIINDILDLSKIEAGKMTLSVEDVDIQQLVKGIYHINKALASEKGIQFKYDFGGDIPKIIKADRTKLNQILMNLISNSIKFTPSGKEIMVKLLSDKEKKSFILSVEDQGIGIPQNRIESIFKPFEQADDTTTREYGGTGLGLTITKKMVELMGGRLDVESKEGEGSKFFATIPMIESEASELFETDVTLDNYIFSKDSKILVIEDNPLNQEMMRALFGELDLEIEVADDGAEGLNMIKEIVPDLVLLDLHMPVMDGIEVVTNIRSDKQYDKIPIVVLSADAFREKQKEAFKVGVNDYLTKPLDFHKLMPVLVKYLKHEGEIKESPKPERLTEMPEDKKNKINSELAELVEIPIYQTESLIKKLEEIEALAKGYETFLDFKKIEAAIYSGNQESLNEIIKLVNE